ncbi:serine/threonine-protein kinase PLK1-like [Thalassophryne amazonica]|uniref:serine/threonine-protein kinase PLK1-like n=1 Tax=Thalassophryne amazonica TaxID=390379 RepID=UPI001471C0C7|nr:serine/threonine-protein kinase PLK1-like [Thalassophryne amazonica]
MKPSNVHPKPSSPKDVPDHLVDPHTMKKYTRGRSLGRGSFGKVYEITDVDSKQVFACKMISKSHIQKRYQKENLKTEISILQSLSHHHIISCHSVFEDEDFVFVVLELCSSGSLSEVLRFRQTVMEPEAHYLMMQLLKGVEFLHKNKVGHRDLKPDNIFFNDRMEVKIGDFGLSTTIKFEGELKKARCGTLNYVAPEVLSGNGYSYQVDVWSLGCVLYTMLVGQMPFHTSSWTETVNHIMDNEYTIPDHISPAASSLIRQMLCADPAKRPTVTELQTHKFFTGG